MARAEGDIVITVGGNVSPLTDAVSMAERTLGKLNTATKRADKEFRAMVGTSTAMQARIDALSGATERTGKSAERAAKAFEGFDRSRQAIDRLRASYDPMFAASKRYEAAVEELDDALQLGVITQQQYASMTENLAAKMLRVDGAAGTMGQQIKKTAGFSRDLGHQVQNASYQVGDFFVQIAGGQSATLALAQQLPQLLGAFGMFGALAGAAVAIGGALVPMLFSTGEKAKTTQDAIDKLSSSLDAYTGYLEVASAGTSELTEKYGAFAGRVRELSEYMSQVALGKGMEDLAASLEPIKGGLSEVSRLTAEVAERQAFLNSINKEMQPDLWFDNSQILAIYVEELNQAAAAMGLTVEQATSLAAAIDRVGQAKGMKEVAAAAADAADLIQQMFQNGTKLPGPLRDADTALRQIAMQAAAAAKQEQEMHSWANRVKTVLGDIWAGTPGSGWLAGEISDAAKLAQNLWEAARAKAAALSTGQQKLERSKPRNALDRLNQTPELWEEEDAKKGGGGGGKKDDPKEKYADFAQDLMTEAELEKLNYDERLKQLAEFNGQKLMTQEQYNANLERIQQQHQDRMAAIDVYRYGDGLQKAGAFMGDMASALQSGNEKMQKIGQKFAAAEALINAWRAYTQTLADPTLPFMAKFAAGAKVFAAAMGAVNAIKGGGGGGGSARTTAAASSAAAQDTYQPTTVNIAWQGDMTASSLGSLTEKLNREHKRGYRLNFTPGAA